MEQYVSSSQGNEEVLLWKKLARLTYFKQIYQIENGTKLIKSGKKEIITPDTEEI